MKNFGKKVGEFIKVKAIDFGNGIKAGFIGIKGMSKEQYYELIEKAKGSLEEVGKAMDVDNDGGITTKDIKDGFSAQKLLEEKDKETK